MRIRIRFQLLHFDADPYPTFQFLCGAGSRSYHSLFTRFGPSSALKWPSKASTFSLWWESESRSSIPIWCGSGSRFPKFCGSVSGSATLLLATYKIWWKSRKCVLLRIGLCFIWLSSPKWKSTFFGVCCDWIQWCSTVQTSVVDPDPYPPDPHVFGPPGSGSGSFYQHAKMVRKILIHTIFWLFLTFYLWKMGSIKK